MPGLAVEASEIVALVPKLDLALAESQIVRTLALAKVKAPCLFHNDSDADRVEAGRSILIDALARWAREHVREVGELATKTQTMGPFGQTITVDTRRRETGVVWEKEWSQLVELCGRTSPSGGPRGSFPAPDGYARHFGL